MYKTFIWKSTFSKLVNIYLKIFHNNTEYTLANTKKIFKHKYKTMKLFILAIKEGIA